MRGAEGQCKAIYAVGTANARPFSANDVPARADVVLHVDATQMRRSSLWKSIDKLVPGGGINAMKTKLRADFMKDWLDEGRKPTTGERLIDTALDMLLAANSLTIWIDRKEKGAFLLDVPRAARYASTFKTLLKMKASTDKGVTIYGFEGDDSEVFMAVHNNMLIFADNKRYLLRATRILQGKGRSLAKTNKLRFIPARKGIVFAASFGGKFLEGLRDKAKARSLKADLKSIAVHAGDHGGLLFARLEAQTDSKATADKLTTMGQGFKALLSLADDEPELKTLVSGLSITSRGPSVSAKLEIPVKTLIKLAKDNKK